MKTLHVIRYSFFSVFVFFLGCLLYASYHWHFSSKSLDSTSSISLSEWRHLNVMQHPQSIKAKHLNRGNVKYYSTWSEIHAKKLNDMSKIYRQNSDPLPTISYFNAGSHSNLFINGTSSIDENDTILPKFKPFDAHWLSVPSRKLLTCIIPKNMSSMLRALICYLYNPRKFVADGRRFHTELSWKSSCANEFGYLVSDPKGRMDALILAVGVNGTDPAQFLDEWLLFALVRDPISRFLSSYADKRISHPIKEDYCNGCGQNMTCFIVREYERLMTRQPTDEITFEDWHFAPQNWHCDFARHLNAFRRIRYNESDIDVVIGQLKAVIAHRPNVISESELDYISRELHAKRTFHSTVGSHARVFLEERLRGSPFLMELLVKMYYWDFVLFGYTIPETHIKENGADIVNV